MLISDIFQLTWHESNYQLISSSQNFNRRQYVTLFGAVLCAILCFLPLFAGYPTLLCHSLISSVTSSHSFSLHPATLVYLTVLSHVGWQSKLLMLYNCWAFGENGVDFIGWLFCHHLGQCSVSGSRSWMEGGGVVRANPTELC